jgi:transcriptional regulator with XRE-family HTH domain
MPRLSLIHERLSLQLVNAFPDNLNRLLGLHGLAATDAASVLGVSPQAVSEWRHGKRGPSVQMLLKLSEVFEVPADALMRIDFKTLLEREAGDPTRFERVEQKLARARKAKRRPKPTSTTKG